MVLACRALGLGTTLTNRHMFFQKEVDRRSACPGRALLRHPSDRLSDGQVRPVKRAPLDAVVYQDRWGQPYAGWERIRLHRGRRRIGRRRRRLPVVGRSAQQGAAAGGGRGDHPWTRMPVGSARLITNPAANWLYSAEPEANTNGRRLPVPRGKLLGGSSAINGMAFVRGQAQDFDTWAQMGNRGWSYETCCRSSSAWRATRARRRRYRGRDGPLRSPTRRATPLFAR
jgi:hypothetical protein